MTDDCKMNRLTLRAGNKAWQIKRSEKEKHPPVHWDKRSPGLQWPLDIPAGLRATAEVQCMWPCGALRSCCTDERLCSAVHGGHQLLSLGSTECWSLGFGLLDPNLHTFEMALIDRGLTHGQGSEEV